MLDTTSDPASITLSTAAYGLLLKFYPPRFQREYGPHMAQVFRDCSLRAHRQSGPQGMLALWALTLFDWFKTVLEEQLNRGTDMTRTKFVRLSGWGMMLGAVAILLGFLSDPNRIQVALYRLLGSPSSKAEFDLYRSFADNVNLFLVLSGISLLILGVAGLRMRYGDQTGGLGSHSLLLSMLGGGVAFVGALPLPVNEATWGVIVTGLTAQFGFLALFGVSAMRSQPLPRWNGLPLLAGIWLPLFVFAGLTYDLLNRGAMFYPPSWIGTTMISATFLSLVLLGYVLQSDPPEERMAL